MNRMHHSVQCGQRSIPHSEKVSMKRRQFAVAMKSCAIIAIALLTSAGPLFVSRTSQAAEQRKPILHRVPMAGQQSVRSSVQVAKTGWALQGRVLDAQLQPVVNFTIFLVDAESRYVEQYGSAHTDNTGYFLLNYAGNRGQAPAATQLFLEVANTNGTRVYLSTTSFRPVYGAVSSQNITLPARK